MDDNAPQEDTYDRLLALEAQVASLETMMRRITALALNRGNASGYDLRRIKLAQEAIRLKFINPTTWD